MSFSYAHWVAQNRTARYRLSRKSGWLAYCDSGPRVDLPILSRAEAALLAEDDLEDYHLARRTWVSNLPIVRTQQVHHAFTVLDLSRIEAACLPENAASRGVLEKTGFKYEGVAQAYLQIAGRWRNHVLYANLRADRRGRTDAG